MDNTNTRTLQDLVDELNGVCKSKAQPPKATRRPQPRDEDDYETIEAKRKRRRELARRMKRGKK